MRNLSTFLILGSLLVASCGDLVQAQGFGSRPPIGPRPGGPRPGQPIYPPQPGHPGHPGQPGYPGHPGYPQPQQPQQYDVQLLMQSAELLSEAVSMTVFDRHRVQINIREAQRIIQTVLMRSHSARIVQRELSQAQRILQEPRLVLERKAADALRLVGYAINRLTSSAGHYGQDLRQTAHLVRVLAVGTVFDGAEQTAQHLGYLIQNSRYIDRFRQQRLLQQVTMICNAAGDYRMNRVQKIRIIENAVNQILYQL